MSIGNIIIIDKEMMETRTPLIQIFRRLQSAGAPVSVKSHARWKLESPFNVSIDLEPSDVAISEGWVMTRNEKFATGMTEWSWSKAGVP